MMYVIGCRLLLAGLVLGGVSFCKTISTSKSVMADDLVHKQRRANRAVVDRIKRAVQSGDCSAIERQALVCSEELGKNNEALEACNRIVKASEEQAQSVGLWKHLALASWGFMVLLVGVGFLIRRMK